MAEGVFSEPLSELPGFRSLDGAVSVQTPWSITVPARAYLFRGPGSYTRQDIVEIHLPGEVVASVVCSALIDAGARQADAGEFTARAFMSGRIDLSAAQAVADVIDAQADAQLRSAVGVMDGALASLCRPAAETLTEALAVTEASIDFADEGLILAATNELAATVRKVADDLDDVLSTSGRWSASDSEIRVAIAGRPNAGKSSLLNALSQVDRAIVSVMSGTTRDVLTAPATLTENLEVMLLDAAGLEAFAQNPDPLTLAAHRAAREAIQSADAVLFVIDATTDDHDADERLLTEVVELNPRAPMLILANKIDLLEKRGHSAFFPISAMTGEGLDNLRRVLADRLGTSAAPKPGTLLLHDRQRRGISAAAEASRRCADMFQTADEITDVSELASVELRSALANLAELTGEVSDEDVLSTIFSRFCVGK